MTFLNPLARQRTAVDLPREGCSRDCPALVFLLALDKAVAVIYHTILLFVLGLPSVLCRLYCETQSFWSTLKIIPLPKNRTLL